MQCSHIHMKYETVMHQNHDRISLKRPNACYIRLMVVFCFQCTILQLYSTLFCFQFFWPVLFVAAHSRVIFVIYVTVLWVRLFLSVCNCTIWPQAWSNHSTLFTCYIPTHSRLQTLLYLCISACANYPVHAARLWDCSKLKVCSASIHSWCKYKQC